MIIMYIVSKEIKTAEKSSKSIGTMQLVNKMLLKISLNLMNITTSNAISRFSFRNLKGQYHFVTSWFQKKKAWIIIIWLKIAIAFDYIYQEIKWSE